MKLGRKMLKKLCWSNAYALQMGWEELDSDDFVQGMMIKTKLPMKPEMFKLERCVKIVRK